MRPHEWLGVAYVPAPRADRRPAVYLAATAAVVLAALATVRAVPHAPVAAGLHVPAVARARAVALVRVDPDAFAPALAAAPPPAAAPVIAMVLPEASVAIERRPPRRGASTASTAEPAERERERAERELGPGILGDPGLDGAIDTLAGHRDLAAGMAAVERAAGPGRFEPVPEDGCGARCFGGSLRTPKRDCVFGEHLDPESGRCVPDDPHL